MMVGAVDLNADLAEGEDLSAGDLEVLDSVTSVSLACGFHAGNRDMMRATAEAALAAAWSSARTCRTVTGTDSGAAPWTWTRPVWPMTSSNSGPPSGTRSGRPAAPSPT